MPLKVGQKAPDFKLKDTKGNMWKFPLTTNTCLLVFYKVSCPTCQLTLPFVEKLYKAYGSKITFLGIAQDTESEVKDFLLKYKLSFPQLIDAPAYSVSLTYDIKVVPTLYLINAEGEIISVEESFVKSFMEFLNEKLAHLCAIEPISLFEGISVPSFKPG